MGHLASFFSLFLTLNVAWRAVFGASLTQLLCGNSGLHSAARRVFRSELGHKVETGGKPVEDDTQHESP